MAYDFSQLKDSYPRVYSQMSDRAKIEKKLTNGSYPWDKHELLHAVVREENRQEDHMRESFARMLEKGYCKALTDDDVAKYYEASEVPGATADRYDRKTSSYKSPDDFDGPLSDFLSQHDGVAWIDTNNNKVHIYTGGSYTRAMEDIGDVGLGNAAAFKGAGSGAGVWTFVDSIERQKQHEREAAAEAARVFEPKSVVKMCHDQKFVKDKPVLAIYYPHNVTYAKDDPSRMTGAYVDVQLDQTMLKSDDIKAGKGFSNPHVNYTSRERKGVTPNQVWYSKKQLDMMEATGSSFRSNPGGHVISFTANLMSRDDKSGGKTTVVLLPKEITSDMKPDEKAAVEVYNKLNQIKPSQHGDNLDTSVWGKQCDVMDKICAVTHFPGRSKRDWTVMEPEVLQQNTLQDTNDMELG